MAPSGWHDVEGVNYGPVEGKPETYGRRDGIEELAEIFDWELAGYQTKRGVIQSSQMEQIMECLGIYELGVDDSGNFNGILAAKELADYLDFDRDISGDYDNSFSGSNLYEIIQAVKHERGENQG